MTLAQGIYAIAALVYTFFFMLFCRFFLWKRYAERNFWHQRPQLSQNQLVQQAQMAGRDLPFITVMIPARDEAAVIRRTVEHMFTLRYSPRQWQMVVVTDEKERLARDQRLDTLVEDMLVMLDKGQCWQNVDQLELLVATFASLLKEQMGAYVVPAPLIRDVAMSLLQQRGRVVERRLQEVLRCHMPMGAQVVELERYVTLALPVARACLPWCERDRVLQSRLRQLQQCLALKCCTQVTEFSVKTTQQLVKRLHELSHLQLREALCQSAMDLYPTTGEEVERSRAVLGDSVRLQVVEVPFDHDGDYGGAKTGLAVSSTKGRALNCALSSISADTEIFGFYDAESRPHPDVLLYVAHRHLSVAPPEILQGPVFQVRNFFMMHPICRIAGLYQAVAHEWYLPALFKRLPFVGGTNLFINAQLLRSLRGFARDSLTEDLELGVRAFLQTGAWPQYLPYHSSEQTPPTVKAFMRQRLRWGSGHLQVFDKVKRLTDIPRDRQRHLVMQLFLKGQLEWVLYQGATLVPPTLIILWSQGLVDGSWLPWSARFLLHGFTLTYFSFTFYAYRRYSTYFDRGTTPRTWLGRGWVLLQVLLLPLAAFLFPLPYTHALVLKLIGREPKTWTKTPRTRE